MLDIFVFSAAFLLSYFGVEKFRQWSLKKRIIDVPNERSSHAAPTPRGGGLIFVVICLSFYAVNGLTIQSDFRWSYLIGAVLIAFVSWLDDLYSVKTLNRFIVHGLAAFLVLYSGGYWHEINVPYFGTINLGVTGAVLTFLWIVGLTNAYNFMDGIDGIAAAQAVMAGIGWLFAGKLLGSDQTAVYAGVLAFSCLGFLIHNRPPAKIFMGDVGSAFLGYSFAVLPILAKVENQTNSNRDAIFPLIGVLFVWFFVFDAAYTFFNRLLKKHKVWEAHREHLYQKLVIKGFSHAKATAIYGAFSIVVTATAASAATYGNICLIFATFLAISLSVLLVVFERRAYVNPQTVNGVEK